MVKRLKRQVKIISKKVKLELKVEPNEGIGDIEDKPNIFKFINENDLVEGIKYPKNWVEIYNNIVEMRSKIMAPVDTMGCERIPTTITPRISKTDPQMFRFQLLLSLMLSSQTKDEVNFEAMKNLNEGLQQRGFKGATIESVLSLEDKELDAYIGKVGFHNRKTVYIKKACQILLDEFNGDIPKTIEDIVKLPGVGPKMGYLLLHKSWNINEGIGVDVHVHRLANVFKWTKTANPELTRRALEQWLPKQYWADINPLLVGFGQLVCTPTTKNCDICKLGNLKLCPSADRKLVNRPLTEERIKKLETSRGDLSLLIN